VRYNWPMSAHASQAFSIAHCTDSEVCLKLHCQIIHEHWQSEARKSEFLTAVTFIAHFSVPQQLAG